MGPGKVVFQDGKVIFVRHGSIYVSVSASRIDKKDEEFGRDESSDTNRGKVQKKNLSNDAFIEAEETEVDIERNINNSLEIETDETVEEESTRDVDNVTDSQQAEETVEHDFDEQFEEHENDMNENEECSPTTDPGLDQTVVTSNGKRKRNENMETEHSIPREKRVAVEGDVVISKTRIVFPPNTKEKIKLKKGDTIELEENGQLI